MAREKELYRDYLVRLREVFGDRDIVPLKEVSAYVGMQSETLKRDKTFPVKKIGRMYMVPVIGLASWMA